MVVRGRKRLSLSTLGISEAAGRADSMNVCADASKTPLQGIRHDFRKPLFGARATGALGFRAAHGFAAVEEVPFPGLFSSFPMESSTNFVNWSVLRSMRASNRPVPFLDASPAIHACRFYRAVSSP
jgi:hypothetical protein